jgi:hypothetical protein
MPGDIADHQIVGRQLEAEVIALAADLAAAGWADHGKALAGVQVADAEVDGDGAAVHGRKLASTRRKANRINV